MIKGNLVLYFETGMEGAEWAMVYRGNKKSRVKVHFLEQGEGLRIYEGDKTLWQGKIDKDTKKNLSSKTGYPYKRQVVEGYIVHWLQRGVKPKDWANWFLSEKECELEKVVGQEFRSF